VVFVKKKLDAIIERKADCLTKCQATILTDTEEISLLLSQQIDKKQHKKQLESGASNHSCATKQHTKRGCIHPSIRVKAATELIKDSKKLGAVHTVTSTD
jgi:hypothetical protein